MKTSIVLFFYLSFFLFFASCKKEDEPSPASKFKGTWNIVELYTPAGGSQTTYEFDITIAELPDGKIQIQNFADLDDISATVNGNSFTITDQTILEGGEIYKANGTGTLTGNVLNMSYTLKTNAGAAVASATATGTK